MKSLAEWYRRYGIHNNRPKFKYYPFGIPKMLGEDCMVDWWDYTDQHLYYFPESEWWFKRSFVEMFPTNTLVEWWDYMNEETSFNIL